MHWWLSQTGGYGQKEQMQSGNPDSILEEDTGGNLEPDVNKPVSQLTALYQLW